MVFNWFQREAAPQPEPAPEQSATSEQSALQEENSSTQQSSTPEPDPTPSPTPEPASPSASQAAESGPDFSSPTPAVSKEDEALVWAREAYARLKAQQQAAAQTQPEPAPVSTPPLTSDSTPDSTSEPITTPESSSETAPSEPEPSSSESSSSTSSPGLSLLEQAAAQRRQRQQEQEIRAMEVEAEIAPAAPAQPAVESEPETTEPSLGEFDEDFTWSAEVLAAQGRRADQVSLEEIDWLGRLRRGLEKTRQGFVAGLLENLGDDPLTPEVLDDLETLLLRADAGVQATDQVLEALRQRMNQEVVDPEEGIRFLKEQLRGLLDEPINASGSPLLAPERGRLNIWLMVGVNGVGKTTTLGKLANLAVRSGYSALIAAGDTFRAAAVQQVQVWGQRSDVPVVSNPTSNADPAAVVFDAIGAARSRGSDLLLVDTAGRLQTKHNLMEELQKVRKIIDRLAPEAKVESLLVLDASQGQNGLRQAMAFAQAAGLTGVVITKLDGTARGGVALAVASEAQLPIRFIGAGEGIRDLRPFNSFEFVEALLAGR